MADTTTTKHALIKPEVHASDDTWGTKLNTDLDQLDSLIDIRASTAEAVAGTATNRTVTPDALAALWRLGSPVPAAPILVLGDGGVFVITAGTGPITDIDFGAASRNGRAAWLIFNTAVTLTHSATLNLIGAADITAASQDMALVIQEGGDNVRMLAFNRGIFGSSPLNAASTTEVLTGTSVAKVVTPDALAALWEYGGAVAAASNTVLGEGAYFYITGTGVTINDFTLATSKTGRTALVEIGGGSHTLVHSATLDLPGAANITALPGDRMLIAVTGASLRKVVFYQRADGTIFPGNAATTTEVLTGTNAAKLVTPDALAALWEFGTSVAAAANTVLGEGGIFYVTGSGVTISDISFATGKGGRTAWLHFNNGHTLVNSANLLLPVAGNITVAQSDRLLVVQTGPTTREVLLYQRADGTPLVADTSKVNIAGDTMTGDLTIAKANPTLLVDATSGTSAINLRGVAGAVKALFLQTGTLSRWGFVSDASAEGGANAGSNLALRRYNDAGTLIDAPIAIDRATGQINLAAGLLAFPATQNPSAGVNVLDDYEEGTFSPDLTFGGLKVGLTYGSQSGTYTKIGRMVQYNIYIVLTAKGTSTGVASIGALPFTAAAVSHVAPLLFNGTSGVGDTALIARIAGSGSAVNLYKQSAGIIAQMSDADFINTTQLTITGTYIV